MSTDLDTVADAPGSLKRVEGADGTTLDDRHRYARALSTADDVIPKGLWSPVRKQDGTMGPPAPSPGKILVVTEIARMLGFHPLAGIMGVHIIEGKPSISPAMMSARVRTAGHTLRVGTKGSVEGGNLTAFARLIRSDDPEFVYEVEWSLLDAQRAKLGELTRRGEVFEWGSGKDNWRKYPRAMLKARAIAEVCREAAEDVLMGAAYIPDELGAVTDEDGAAIDQRPVAPTRDWRADIAAAQTTDELVTIREQLRNAPDFSSDHWNALMARFGILAAREEVIDDEPVDGEVEDESGGNSGDEHVQHIDPIGDDPAWNGEPCPACGRQHDPSVHDGEEVQS